MTRLWHSEEARPSPMFAPPDLAVAVPARGAVRSLRMTYTDLGATGEFLEYPTNRVVGVFADWGHARATIDQLAAGGFTPEQIGALCGPEGAKRLDASGQQHGILAQISRFFQGFADMDEKHTKRHEQELLAGHALVSVAAADDAKREQIRQVMKAHGGYFINYYGKWVVENLEA
jgi:hypothetical protein